MLTNKQLRTLDIVAENKEDSRVKYLSSEREGMQKEVFTRWINMIMNEASHAINRIDIRSLTPNLNRRFVTNSILPRTYIVKDIFDDLRDGIVLAILIEILSGRKSKVINSPLRIHYLENIANILEYLIMEKGLHLENIGPQDIVDGNHRLTLGLIWSIILHFQIDSITIPEPTTPGEVKNARAALLLWCQLKTADYEQVNVINFTSSWVNGLAFCALLHKHRPDLIDYQSMVAFCGPINRLEVAFNQADLHLGIPRLLNPRELIDRWWKDEKSMITLIVTWYHWLNQNQEKKKGALRLSRLIGLFVRVEKMLLNYKAEAAKWFIRIIRDQAKLSSISEGIESIPLSCLEINQHLRWLMNFRNTQKPKHSIDRNKLEFDAFNIRTIQLSEGLNFVKIQSNFAPTVFDRAWSDLDKIEHNCDLKIHQELIKSNLRQQFDRKAKLRINWLEENNRILENSLKMDQCALNAELRMLRQLFDQQHLNSNESSLSPMVLQNRIIGTKMKHNAFQTDACNYASVRLSSLRKVFDELKSKVPASQYQNESKTLESIEQSWVELKEKLEFRKMGLELLIQTYQNLFELNGYIDDIRKRSEEVFDGYDNAYIMPEHVVNRIFCELTESKSARDRIQTEIDQIWCKMKEFNEAYELVLNSLILDRFHYFEKISGRLGGIIRIVKEKIDLCLQVAELHTEIRQELSWTREMKLRAKFVCWSTPYVEELLSTAEFHVKVYREKSRYRLTNRDVFIRQHDNSSYNLCYFDQLRFRKLKLADFIQNDYLAVYNNLSQLDDYTKKQVVYFKDVAQKNKNQIEEIWLELDSEKETLKLMLNDLSNHIDCLIHYSELFDISDDLLRSLDDIFDQMLILSRSIPFTEQEWPTEESTANQFTVNADLRKLEKLEDELFDFPKRLEKFQRELYRTNPELTFKAFVCPKDEEYSLAIQKTESDDKSFGLRSKVNQFKTRDSFDSGSSSSEFEDESLDQQIDIQGTSGRNTPTSIMLPVGVFGMSIVSKMRVDNILIDRKLNVSHLRSMPFFGEMDMILCNRLQKNWRQLNQLKIAAETYRVSFKILLDENHLRQQINYLKSWISEKRKWLNEFHPAIEPISKQDYISHDFNESYILLDDSSVIQNKLQLYQKILAIHSHQWISFESQHSTVATSRLAHIEQIFVDLQIRCKGLSNLSLQDEEDLAIGFLAHFESLQVTLNEEWGLFNEQVKAKKRRLESALRQVKYHERQRALYGWIESKKKILSETDSINTKRLGGIMELQRRLQNWDKDIAEITEAVNEMKIEAEHLSDCLRMEGLVSGSFDSFKMKKSKLSFHTEDQAANQISRMNKSLYENLKLLLHHAELRAPRFEESKEKQEFFRNLDQFILWQRRAHNDSMMTDTVQEIDACQRQLNIHKELKIDIDEHQNNFERLLEKGRDIVDSHQEQLVAEIKLLPEAIEGFIEDDQDDYDHLRDQLKVLEIGWTELQHMWQQRDHWLEQTFQLLVFQRDITQAEILLSHQETRILGTRSTSLTSRTETDLGLIRAAVNEQRALIKTIEMNTKERIEKILKVGDKMISDNHYAADRIAIKNDSIRQKFKLVKESSIHYLDDLCEQLLIRETSQTLIDLDEWFQEKSQLLQDMMDVCRDHLGRQVSISRRYAQHRAFEAELDANDERIKIAFQNLSAQLDSNPLVKEKIIVLLEACKNEWQALRERTRRRGSLLVEEHRAVIFNEGCGELSSWLDNVNKDITTRPVTITFQEARPHYLSHDSTRLQLTGTSKVNTDGDIESSSKLVLSATISVQPYTSFFGMGVESVPDQSEAPCDSLMDVNSRLKKLRDVKQEMEIKFKQMEDLHVHAEMLAKKQIDADFIVEIQKKQFEVEKRFNNILSVLSAKINNLCAQKRIHELIRELLDENDWMENKLEMITNFLETTDGYHKHPPTPGTSWTLAKILQAMRRHSSTKTEVGHRISRILLLQQEATRNEIDHASGIQNQLDTFIPLMTEWIRNEIQTASKKSDQVLSRMNLILNQDNKALKMRHDWFYHLEELHEVHSWLSKTKLKALNQGQRADRNSDAAWAILKQHENLEYHFVHAQVAMVKQLTIKTKEFRLLMNTRILNLNKELNVIKSAKKDFLRVSNTLQNLNEKEMTLERRKFRRSIHEAERDLSKLEAAQKNVEQELDTVRDLCAQKRHRLKEILAISLLWEDICDFESWIYKQCQDLRDISTGRNSEECSKMLRRVINFRESYLNSSTFTICRQFFIMNQNLNATPAVAALGTWDPPGSVTLLTMGKTKLVSNSKISTTEGVCRLHLIVGQCRRLIQLCHTDAPRIAFWQDRIEEAWADLCEWMATREQLLINAVHRHIYLERCDEAYVTVVERTQEMAQEIGQDSETLNRLQRRHMAFERDLQALKQQVDWVLKVYESLKGQYAGSWSAKLKAPRDALKAAWFELQKQAEMRRQILQEMSGCCFWLTMHKSLLQWVVKRARQVHMQLELSHTQAVHTHSNRMRLLNRITGTEIHKCSPEEISSDLFIPRDISEVQLLISTHKNLRSEIEAREEVVSICLAQGLSLYQRLIRSGRQLDYSQCIPTSRVVATGNTDILQELQGLDKKPFDEVSNELSTIDFDWDEVASEISLRIPLFAEMEDLDCSFESVQDEIRVYKKFEPSSLDLSERKLSEYDSITIEPPKKTIKKGLMNLAKTWHYLWDDWNERWRQLHFMLDVYQFGRDAALAEKWLADHEGYLRTQEYGETLEDTLQLLKKQEAFEMTAETQSKKFDILFRLTQLEKVYFDEIQSMPVDEYKRRQKMMEQEHWGQFLNQHRLNELEPSSDSDEGSIISSKIKCSNQPTQFQKQNSHRENEVDHLYGQVLFTDVLSRKHQWETNERKAPNRSWKQLYVVLHPGLKKLLFYRTRFRFDPENPLISTYHNEIGIDINEDNISVSPALDYRKRKNVFRLKILDTGAEYLFETSNESSMLEWIHRINAVLKAKLSMTQIFHSSTTLAKNPEPLIRSRWNSLKKSFWRPASEGLRRKYISGRMTTSISGDPHQKYRQLTQVGTFNSALVSSCSFAVSFATTSPVYSQPRHSSKTLPISSSSSAFFDRDFSGRVASEETDTEEDCKTVNSFHSECS